MNPALQELADQVKSAAATMDSATKLINRLAPSLARKFYERFRADPQNTLDSIFSEPVKESFWIDYKSRPMKDTKPDWEGLRFEWTRAISGFANTEGGILVFGVDAPDEVPTDRKPFPEVDKFMSKLDEWKLTATDKAVLGVETFSFSDSVDPTLGYVVAYIPSGANKPYRAEHGIKNYYYRAEHSFVVIPPSHLRQLFYPQYRPDYQFSLELESNSSPTRPSYKLFVYLKNAGPGSASNCCLSFETNRTCVHDSILRENVLRFFASIDIYTLVKPVRTDKTMVVNLNAPLHPGMEKLVAYISFDPVPGKPNHFDDLALHLHVFADSVEPRLFQFIIPGSKLRELAQGDEKKIAYTAKELPYPSRVESAP